MNQLYMNRYVVDLTIAENLSYLCIICHFYDMYHHIANHPLHKRIGIQNTNAFTE